jgi:hypothetical protein
MAYTEFYAQTTGSDLNAGSGRTDAAAFTYVSAVVVGGWNAATGVFTVATGNPSGDGVAVGDFASVYVTSGATVAVFIGRITTRDTTTITVSLTAKSGTPPATDALGATTIKVGGAWKGPNGASLFPWTLIQNTMTNASGHVPRTRFLSGTDYVLTAGGTYSNAGPAVYSGYRALLATTAVAATDIFTSTAHGFVTGDVAVLDSGTGFGGVVVNREYYVIKIDNNTFYLASSYYRALFGSAFRVDVTSDGSAGVVSAPARAKITGTTGVEPFIMLLISGTRSIWRYLEFATNGFNAGPVNTGDYCIQSNSGGTGLYFYRCKFTETYRDGLRCGGGAGMVYECEFNGCNVNAGNGFAQLNFAAAGTAVRCWAHHSFKTGDAGCPGFMFQAGTGNKVNGNFTNGLPELFQGTIDLTASPFVDATNGNLALNDTAGGGAELRGTGAGIFFSSGTSAAGSYSATTRTYQDVNAAQHLESDSGGSGFLVM